MLEPMASISESGMSSPIGGGASSSGSDDDTSHGDKVCATLNSLRKGGFLCDVTLISNGKLFPALKAILVSHSSFFKVMFVGHSSYKDKATVTLNNVEPYVLEILLDFMYSGDLKSNEKTILDILEASLFMLIPEVVKECCFRIKNDLVLENCVRVWQYIRWLSSLCHRPEELKYLADLEKYAKKSLLENFQYLCKQQEFLKLSGEELIEIISNNTLNVSTEEQVLQSVVLWILDKNQPEWAEKVLPHVRLALLDRYLFDNFILSIRHLLNSPLCQRLLNKATDFQSLVLRRMELQSPLSRCRFSHSKVFAIRVCFDTRLSKQQTSVFLTEGGKLLKKDRWSGHHVQPINHHLLRWDLKNCSLKIYGVDVNLRKNAVTQQTAQEKTKRNWEDFGRLPTPRVNIGMGELDGKFYAIGGSYLDSRAPCDIIEQCHPATKVWRKVATLPIGLSTPIVASLGGCLYIVGGPTDYSVNVPTTSLVFGYSARSNKVGKVDKLPRGFVCSDLHVLNRKLYFSLISCCAAKWVLCSLDVTTHLWKRCADMNHKSVKSGTASMNGYLYGISTRSSDRVKIIERYSPWSNSWTDFAMFPDSSPSHLAGPFPFGSKRKAVEGKWAGVTMLNDFSVNDEVLLYLNENHPNL